MNGAEQRPDALERRLGEHRYGVTLFLTLAVVMFAVSAPDARWARAVGIALQGLMLVVVIITSGVRLDERRRLAVLVAVTVTGLAVLIALRDVRQALALGLAGVLVIAALPTLARGVVRLLRTQGVTIQAVFGALTIYLMLGLVFAFAIGVTADLSPSPYFGVDGEGDVSDHVYFSFTSLTTTGFGDLAAATRFGRGLTVLETLIGTIYLVTVIALLVSNLRPGRRA